jgi:hypothetical protein
LFGAIAYPVLTLMKLRVSQVSKEFDANAFSDTIDWPIQNHWAFKKRKPENNITYANVKEYAIPMKLRTFSLLLPLLGHVEIPTPCLNPSWIDPLYCGQ